VRHPEYGRVNFNTFGAIAEDGVRMRRYDELPSSEEFNSMDALEQLKSAMATLRCSRTALQCQIEAFDMLRGEIGGLLHGASTDLEARRRLECVGARMRDEGRCWIERLEGQADQVERGMRDVDAAVRRVDAGVGIGP
jgi:hypothetical protein